MFTLKRRQFLVSASAAVLLPKPALSFESTQVLEAGTGAVSLVSADYPDTKIWGYNGITPGPKIRVQQGARVQRRLVNSLDQPTTIH